MTREEWVAEVIRIASERCNETNPCALHTAEASWGLRENGLALVRMVATARSAIDRKQEVFAVLHPDDAQRVRDGELADMPTAATPALSTEESL